MEVKIEESWKKVLKDEFEEPYFKELTTFVKDEYKHKTIYPSPKNIFQAFELTPFNNVEVIILGQDPYHGSGQAIGLSFAVQADRVLPPSLRNIFKEIEDDLGKPLVHTDGDLSRWATQGVLLLNATLTVQASTPGSHQGHGWELFTGAAIKALSEKREHVVFILWGNYARQKVGLIDQSKHFIIQSAHPSPFSATHGFFGSNPFSKTNEYLREHNKKPIDWL